MILIRPSFFQFNIKNFFLIVKRRNLLSEDFRDSDDKLKKIRNYNKNLKKLMGYKLLWRKNLNFLKEKII